MVLGPAPPVARPRRQAPRRLRWRGRAVLQVTFPSCVTPLARQPLAPCQQRPCPGQGLEWEALPRPSCTPPPGLCSCTRTTPAAGARPPWCDPHPCPPTPLRPPPLPCPPLPSPRWPPPGLLGASGWLQAWLPGSPEWVSLPQAVLVVPRVLLCLGRSDPLLRGPLGDQAPRGPRLVPSLQPCCLTRLGIA